MKKKKEKTMLLPGLDQKLVRLRGMVRENHGHTHAQLLDVEQAGSWRASPTSHMFLQG